MEKNKSWENGKISSDDEASITCETSPNSVETKFSENLTAMSLDNEIFGSPENPSISDSYLELSFLQRDRKLIFPEAKVAEFKAVKAKVNDAYTNWKVNEFVLETIKTKSSPWDEQIKEVTTFSRVQCNIKLLSKSGESTNLLGLEDEDLKFPSTSLVLFRKPAFRIHVLESLKANVAKLRLQKKSLQDEFGVHSMKVMEGLLTRERMEQLNLLWHVENLQNKARQQLSSCDIMAQQLVTLRNDSDRHLKTATYNLLRTKALYLQTITSKYREKLDQLLLVGENTRKKMDSEGDNLNTQVIELREVLMGNQKSLAEYKEKEAKYEKYREIVAEYAKLNRQLDHKKETLKMLNDPNMSF